VPLNLDLVERCFPSENLTGVTYSGVAKPIATNPYPGIATG